MSYGKSYSLCVSIKKLICQGCAWGQWWIPNAFVNWILTDGYPEANINVLTRLRVSFYHWSLCFYSENLSQALMNRPSTRLWTPLQLRPILVISYSFEDASFTIDLVFWLWMVHLIHELDGPSNSMSEQSRWLLNNQMSVFLIAQKTKHFPCYPEIKSWINTLIKHPLCWRLIFLWHCNEGGLTD